MKTFFFGVVSILLLSACNPDNCPDELLYELPFTIINPSDTISVGDTIWYESRFDKVLYDKNGNIENEFEDFDFSFISCILTRIDSTEEQGGGFDVEVLPKVGAISLTSVSFGYDYHHLHYNYDPNDGYSIKFGLIIKENGLFLIRFGYFESIQKVQTNCTSHYVGWRFNLNVDNSNFEMLQLSPQTFWQELMISDWNRQGSYCLYVKP
ncbi:MAG: hypothetical protein J0M29_07695 [Chitinophagales bacterium]|nr:hypothetical protein [Chitinophagales bacterium]